MLVPLTTFASDVFFGFGTQTMLRMLMYDSEPALHRNAVPHLDKTAPFLRPCSEDGWLAGYA